MIMIPRRRLISGFSLVEVTLAIGIIAFALITLLGIMPVGLKANKTSVDEIVALGTLGALEADLRTSPSTTAVSAFFRIDRSLTSLQGTGNAKIYLNAQGELTTVDGEKRYRLIVENLSPISSSTPVKSRPYICRAKIAWPANGKVREDGESLETIQGGVEVYLAIYVL
jgi:uncharacterized protein (TIGR02598 family)